jgi:predicted transcriptional regulator
LTFSTFEKIVDVMITKTQIRNTLDSLPENVTIEQVIEHLIFLDKVNKGLDDSENGRTNTVEEARQKLNKWLK